jgi:membrane protease subunit (stomatin/prohibitin family)
LFFLVLGDRSMNTLQKLFAVAAVASMMVAGNVYAQAQGGAAGAGGAAAGGAAAGGAAAGGLGLTTGMVVGGAVVAGAVIVNNNQTTGATGTN